MKKKFYQIGPWRPRQTRAASRGPRRKMIRPWIRGGPGVDDTKLFAAGIDESGNTKGGSITVPLTSCLTGLDWFVLQIKTNIVSCHTADSKPVKHEVNGTVILPL